MLCFSYPSSDNLAIDSRSSLLPNVDLGAIKLGTKHPNHTPKRTISSAFCLKPCRRQKCSGASPAAGSWHRRMDAQASRESPGLVLEPRKSTARTLDAQLIGIRLPDTSEERLENGLASKNDSNRHNFGSSDSECATQEQDVSFNSPKHEGTRQLQRPKNRFDALELVVDQRKIPKVNELMLYLDSLGVDCGRLILHNPTVVTRSIRTVRSLVHTLEYYGLKRTELGRIFNMCPGLIHLTVVTGLKAVVNFLVDEVGLPRADVNKVIKKCPRLLACSVDEQLRPTLRFLLTLGFSRVVSYNAPLLAFSIEDKLVPKLEYLQGLGISFEEAASMVVRFPAIFNYSVKDNLEPKYEYLVNEMGGRIDDLIFFPQFFGFSLENRIKPRHQSMTEHNIRLAIPTMLKLSEAEFRSKFPSPKREYSTKVSSPLKETDIVKFHELLVESSRITDFTQPGTPVLLGA